MRYLNRIQLIGHVGRDPVKPSSENPDFVTFPFAVSRVWKDKGERESRTVWYEVVTSQKGKSETIMQFFKKGDKLFIEGEPSCNVWISKKPGEEGTAKGNIRIELADYIMLGNKPNDSGSSQGKTTDYEMINGERYVSMTSPPPLDKRDPLDDDIPF